MKKAGQFESRIQIEKAGKVVNARMVKVIAEGPDEEAAVEALSLRSWPGRAPPESLDLPKKARMV